MTNRTWTEARRLESWPPPSLGRRLAEVGSSETAPAFVARQPIYDRNMEVYAYEMLFRASNTDHAAFGDVDAATASTIVTTFADIGLDALVGGRLCFVNATREFILNDFALLLPAGRVALEIGRSVAIAPDVTAKLRELVGMGYLIALDDFVARADSLPLLEIAHLAKFDVLSFTDDQLQDQVEALAPYSVKLVAEKIEDYETYERCKATGFDLFQGYFFCQPKTVTGKGIPTNRLSQMQLVAALQNPNVELEELNDVISRDLGVSYRLLRFINSAYFSLPRKVSSVKEALVLLGQRNVRSWAMLVTLAGIDDQPSELVRTALARAKMCELVAQAIDAPDPEIHFTTGLFSVLDAFMNMRMEDVLSELPLAPEVSHALLSFEGPVGDVLSWVLAYENGGFAALEGAGPLAERMLRDSYVQAIAWADETRRSAGDATAA